MPSDNKRSREHNNEQTRKYRPQTRKRKTTKRRVNDERTRRVPTGKRPLPKKDGTQNHKRGNGKNGKKNKFSTRHPKLMIFIKIMIILFLLLCVIGAGVVAGIFFGLFGDDFEITKEELQIGISNSVVVDANGAVLANLSGDEKRKIITLQDMAEYLPKAYVAIEDERFYDHNGVDIKRTAGAILQTLLGNSSYGGSTITQQLVKNITDDDESEGLAGIFRKVREWAKAYQVERMISKQQILELYLNILFVGGEGNLHGVELGAEYYFNKSAKDLTLAECAYMAGINSSPMSYNPFNETTDNTQKIKDKTKTVLNKMKELGYINSEEEYNTAIAEVDNGLNFQKGTISTGSDYSYHTDAVLDQVINQVMEERGVSRQIAENYVYSSGLTIYSTVDTSIQTRLEEEYAKDKYIKSGRDKDKEGNLINEHTQSGMAIVDYKTGYVVGIAGGLGQKETSGWNRATQMRRQQGSAIKPIADVAPALEERIITPATVYDDVKTNFGGDYEPKNEGDDYDGLINIRQFIAVSHNVPALKIMRELTPTKSLEYLNKMGMTSLTKEADNVLSLAIGGTSNGSSPLEMAAAYGTIANDGVYITPTFYTKVVDSSGNTVLTPKQEETRVFSEQTAYLTKSIVQEPVKASNGTAKYCAISGIDVAAKTGTTDESYDRWLCGFTPYYAAATWFGYDRNEEVRGFSQNPAGQIWDAIMTDIHSDLEDATFERPNGIVEETVCRTTGCLATTGCTDTYTEIFASNHLPEKCQGHGSQSICSESGKVATEYCSEYCEVTTNYYGAVLPKEQLKLWTPVDRKVTDDAGRIYETCDIHTSPKVVEPEEPETPVNNTITRPIDPEENTSGGGNTNTGSGGNTSGGDSGDPEEPETPGGNNTSGGTTRGIE